MSEIIVINAKPELTWLSLKMSHFIFPTPLGASEVGRVFNELFQNWKHLAAGGEASFPSQGLMDCYDIEGAFQRDYFYRTFNKFQNMINALFIKHGVFDDLATKAYQTMSVHREYLRFVPVDQRIDQARWCDNSRRFSKVPDYERQADDGRTIAVVAPHPLIVHLAKS